jgi:hypothetical protein
VRRQVRPQANQTPPVESLLAVNLLAVNLLAVNLLAVRPPR